MCGQTCDEPGGLGRNGVAGFDWGKDHADAHTDGTPISIPWLSEEDIERARTGFGADSAWRREYFNNWTPKDFPDSDHRSDHDNCPPTPHFHNKIIRAAHVSIRYECGDFRYRIGRSGGEGPNRSDWLHRLLRKPQRPSK